MPKSIGETDFLDESKVHAHPRLSGQRGFDFLDEVRMHPRLNAGGEPFILEESSFVHVYA